MVNCNACTKLTIYRPLPNSRSSFINTNLSFLIFLRSCLVFSDNIDLSMLNRGMVLHHDPSW